jgi:tetratricopeptide (TPR) repeat protein
MRYLLLYIFLLPFLYGKAQPTSLSADSLEKVINQYPDYDTSKISSIILLANGLANIDSEKELALYKEAYRQSEKIQNPRLLTKASHGLGVCYYFKGDFKKAEKYLITAVDIARKNGLKKLASALIDLGQAQDMLEKEAKALSNTLEGIRKAEDQKDYDIMISGYNNLAAFYYYRDQNDKALDYYLKARELLLNKADLNKQYDALAITESNIGWCYRYMDNTDKAIEQLKKSVDIHKKYKNLSPSSCNTRNSLASFYIEKGKYEVALRYVNEAMSIANKLKYLEGEAKCYRTLGEINFGLKKYSEAIKNHSKSIDAYKELGDLYQMKINAEFIAETYKAMGDFEKAFAFLKDVRDYSDSLQEINRNAAFEDAITKYESEKKRSSKRIIEGTS